MAESDLPLPETPESAAALPAEGAPDANWWRWGVVVAYLGLIFLLSSQAGQPRVTYLVSDKLLHFVAYAGMAVLVVWALMRGAWRRTTGRAVLLTVFICTAYGLTDEVHQLFVPERYFDLMDIAADAAGAITAAGAVWACGIIARGREQAHDV